MQVSIQKKTVSASEFAECLSPKEVLEACRKCGNFGRLWSCPPAPDGSKAFSLPEGSNMVALLCMRATTDAKDFLSSSVGEIFSSLRADFDARVLEEERSLAKSAAFFAGACANCPAIPGGCPRINAMPCAFPEKMRPSLEALGADAQKILEKYFSAKLDWSKQPKEIFLLAAVAF